MNRTCAKCAFEKVDADMTATESCPNCGVIMSKASIEAAVLKRGIKIPGDGAAKPGRKATLVPLSTVLVAVAALFIGYFVGREHVKYEIARSLSQAASTFRESLGALGSDRPEAPAAKPTRTASPSPIGISLTKMSFREADYSGGDPVNAAIMFDIVISNLSGKSLRAFDGTLEFNDLLGQTVKRVRISISTPIQAQGSINWSGGMDFNQFIASDRQLRTFSATDLQTEFTPRKLLFADGTSEEFQ